MTEPEGDDIHGGDPEISSWSSPDLPEWMDPDGAEGGGEWDLGPEAPLPPIGRPRPGSDLDGWDLDPLDTPEARIEHARRSVEEATRTAYEPHIVDQDARAEQADENLAQMRATSVLQGVDDFLDENGPNEHGVTFRVDANLPTEIQERTSEIIKEHLGASEPVVRRPSRFRLAKVIPKIQTRERGPDRRVYETDVSLTDQPNVAVIEFREIARRGQDRGRLLGSEVYIGPEHEAIITGRGERVELSKAMRDRLASAAKTRRFPSERAPEMQLPDANQLSEGARILEGIGIPLSDGDRYGRRPELMADGSFAEPVVQTVFDAPLRYPPRPSRDETHHEGGHGHGHGEVEPWRGPIETPHMPVLGPEAPPPIEPAKRVREVVLPASFPAEAKWDDTGELDKPYAVSGDKFIVKQMLGTGSDGKDYVLAEINGSERAIPLEGFRFPEASAVDEEQSHIARVRESLTNHLGRIRDGELSPTAAPAGLGERSLAINALLKEAASARAVLVEPGGEGGELMPSYRLSDVPAYENILTGAADLSYELAHELRGSIDLPEAMGGLTAEIDAFKTDAPKKEDITRLRDEMTKAGIVRWKPHNTKNGQRLEFRPERQVEGARELYQKLMDLNAWYLEAKADPEKAKRTEQPKPEAPLDDERIADLDVQISEELGEIFEQPDIDARPGALSAKLAEAAKLKMIKPVPEPGSAGLDAYESSGFDQSGELLKYVAEKSPEMAVELRQRHNTAEKIAELNDYLEVALVSPPEVGKYTKANVDHVKDQMLATGLLSWRGYVSKSSSMLALRPEPGVPGARELYDRIAQIKQTV